jgi:hypothetical protein
LGTPLAELLNAFDRVRTESLARIAELNLTTRTSQDAAAIRSSALSP